MTSAGRIPLNTLAIAFGLAGLADVWTFGAAALTLPVGISIAFWVIAGVSWGWLIVAHTVHGRRTTETLRDQLRHPVQGPIAALAPIVGMLLSASLHPYFPAVSTVLVALFTALTALFAGWIISTWMTGTVTVDSIHGGYFLPTVAGGLIAATTAAEVGLTPVAIGAFAVGAFFWVIMTTVILARLMLRPSLPDPLIPTLAIFVAPPAVAGTARFLMHPVAEPIEYGLAALTVLMLVVQLALVPRYLKLGFSLGFWSFTFPFAAVGAYGIQWLTRLQPAGWQALVVAIIAGVTVLVSAIGFKSIRTYLVSLTVAEVAFPGDQLPAVVKDYLSRSEGDHPRTAIELLSEDAVITDNGTSYTGNSELIDFFDQVSTEFEYTSTLTAASESGGVFTATKVLEGNFPGGIVTLQYRFGLSKDRTTISTLDIGI